MLRAFRFVLVLLTLAVLAMISAVVTMHFAIHGAEVTVPSFKGLNITEATTKAVSAGLSLSVDNHFYSVDIPAGHVVGQTPAPGAVVRRGWHVRLIESLGPQRVAVPNLMGLDERAASIQLRRAALEVGSVANIPWAYAPEGTVIAQNPQPGAAGVALPSVNLLIATKPAVATPAFIMPDLRGQMYSAAALAIAHAGLNLAPPIEAPASIPAVGNAGSSQPIQPVATAGSIISQTPLPGQRVDASTKIELTVAQ